MKKFLKVSGIVVSALCLIVIAYVIYVFAAYERIEDLRQSAHILRKKQFPKAKS